MGRSNGIKFKGRTLPSVQQLSVALSSGVKRLEREAEHSYPSDSEVENAWNYTLFLHTF
jgi:hypothetical protein